MKTRLATIVILLFTTLCTQAQKGGYAKGDKLLNIGLGINSYYSGGIPLGASFEVGVTDDISVGANFDYLSNTYFDEKFTAMYFGGRGAYHFNNLLNISDEKVDLYGGATLGFRSFRWSNTLYDYSYGGYGSGLYLGAFIGGKYYFGSSAGVFAELGAIGSTNARVGLGLKF